MDPTSLEITEGEERDRQGTSHIANPEKREEPIGDLNKQLDQMPPKINPFELLPQLVWVKISDKVEDMQDWLNLYNASSKLKDLLEKDKLGRILPVIFPLMRKYLDRKDVINMCGADTKFASAIISWVQMRCLDPDWAKVGWKFDGISIGIDTPAYSALVDLDSREKMQIVANELIDGGSDSSIPFGIQFIAFSKQVGYWERTSTFLQLFGTRTWGCKFVFMINENLDKRNFVDLLIQYLTLLPNVLRLELEFTYYCAQSPNRVPLAEPSILPQLHKLKVLRLVRSGSFASNFVRVLFGDQLQGWRTELLTFL